MCANVCVQDDENGRGSAVKEIDTKSLLDYDDDIDEEVEEEDEEGEEDDDDDDDDISDSPRGGKKNSHKTSAVDMFSVGAGAVPLEAPPGVTACEEETDETEPTTQAQSKKRRWKCVSYESLYYIILST